MTKGTPPFLFIVPSRRANHEAGLVIRSLHIQIWVDETWGEGGRRVLKLCIKYSLCMVCTYLPRYVYTP